ncbi:MAG: membrane protein insertase YidC [Planctomycetota bacterium]|nr:membrane protein insertase YidC [Planctomycetota bacterium]
MEQRRFLLFLVLSAGILMVWNAFMVPKIAPPANPPARQQAADDKSDDQNDTPVDKQEENVGGETADTDPPADGADSGKADEKNVDVALEEKGEFAPEQRKTVVLGSDDPASGYFFAVELTSQGAAVENLRLNDPRYRDLEDRRKPLQLLTTVPYEKTALRTFDLQCESFDKALQKFDTDLVQMDWQLESTSNDPDLPAVVNKAVFAARHPNNKLILRKTYTVEKVALAGRTAEVAQDNDTSGFLVKVDVSIENLGDEAREVVYTLQGPVGLPLENADNTRKYRDIRAGIIDEGSIEAKTLAAKAVADDAADGQVEEWLRPFRYVGVDVQYFAALLEPLNDPMKDPLTNRYFEKVTPQLIRRASTVEQSDLSILLTSDKLTIKPAETHTHHLQLYAGPKREQLLIPIGAADILDFGMFGFVSKIMVGLLNWLHHYIYVPYGIAIIFLTVMVRGMMYPLSIKQAANAQRMKELQPKLAEIKRKHGSDREKATRAQMELFAEHNYNPLSGCLPIFVQLPIFIGLYAALNSSVDLRMASFLWVDNLAAPDAMFPLPFKIPFVGWSEFNLLPIITIILFIFQQKMFMPPPTDKDQELQFKMMNYMMIFMGFLFYRVPAGLCVYFIASSLWGMGERKLLDRRKLTMKPSTPSPNAKKKGGGFWSKILSAADAAAQQQSTKPKAD